ncbi:Zn-dependent exopeptidase, partial [Fistulina hepatica ATCC 64428]
LFRSVPNVESALAISREYATHPHLAGSVEDFEDAKVILELFQTEFGIPPPKEVPVYPAGSPESQAATLSLTTRHGPRHPTAWVDKYYPVMNTPLDRTLEILNGTDKAIWSADLVEDGDPLDPEAAKYRDAVPTFHGMSVGGQATGQLIYANYGTQEDYKTLLDRGVDFTGKIVLVRYGGIFRGLKIKGAQELGASAVLIYSDPRDNGYVIEENGYLPYPAGPALNEHSVQRGSVQFISSYPGDPTSPGLPAYENVTRTEGSNIPKIPSLPISWANARRLLAEIDDAASSRTLSGKVSASNIKVVNNVDTRVMPIWNAMAAIPGHIRDEVVIVGCHRDAWVMGAADPTSGTVSLHEVIRGFGELVRNGWQPLRTVLFASWDAEEYGLVGSTEFGEDFPEWLAKHAVAYLNLDVSVAGSRWSSNGSPSLAHLIKQAALDVPHPTVIGKSLWDAHEDTGPYTPELNAESTDAAVIDADFLATVEKAKTERLTSPTSVSPLGSGSDYTVFLQRLGIASADEGFSDGGGTDAVYHYHSIYDSQRWQELYADPGFHRHVAVAKHLGLMTLRIADAIVVPLNTTQYALELDDYLDKVESILPELKVTSTPDITPLRASIAALQTASGKLDIEKVEAAANLTDLLDKMPQFPPRCPHRSKMARRFRNWVKNIFGVRLHYGHKHAETIPQDWFEFLDFFESRGVDKIDLEAFPHPPHFPHMPPIRKFIEAAKRVQRVNKKLSLFERGFISSEGLKDREWFRHLAVAPGKWLGYGATTMPGLTESITIDNDVALFESEKARLITLLDKLTEDI